MMTRIRVFAALFALIALSLAGAGALSASTCASGMDSGMVSAAASMMDGCGVEMAPMTDADRSEDTKPTHPEGPQCPMAPAAASGACSTVATVPAEAPDFSALSPESAIVPLSASQTRDLLLVSAFFRPPRA
ncbi:MAG TPA: hypothetical protein VGR37_21950 [Longimicrobiaceae bacterium]|nr:hypothetical protein [Longimicrobiaceae bacterium]